MIKELILVHLVSNSLTDIKSTHLKIALLFWNSKNFFTLLLGGYNFGSSKQIFNFLTDSENLDPKPNMNIKWASWFGHFGRRESQNKEGAPNQGSQRWKIEIAYFPRISFKLGSLHFFNNRNWYQNQFGCFR